MDALKPGGPPGNRESRPVCRLRPGDGEYPGALEHLGDAPDPLYFRGDLTVLQRPCVAIVGSRKATRYGRRVAHDLAREAVRAGWTVLSGMALGIDGAAHQGALDADGGTGAVLGSGPDVPSPRSHAGLLGRILEQGLVLSEHGPGTGARAWHFPRRNRILAALSRRVVVVEAAARSGALITATEAADLGREVWAVPGSIYAPTTPGTHRLLTEGAEPVASLEEWRRSLTGGRGTGGAEPHLALEPAVEGLAARIWAALHGEPRTVEGLVHTLRAAPARVLDVLTELELDGWVEREPDLTYRRRVA